jgi:hypothetical protein
LEGEANNFLDKVGFSKDKEIREKIFKNLGTKPVALNDLVTSTLKPDDFIEMQIQKDEKVVKDCLDFDGDKFYLNLFKEMLKKGNEDGIDTLNIDKATSIIADGPAVKGYHVLAYDVEKGKFKFHSNSMREATRRFIETKK